MPRQSQKGTTSGKRTKEPLSADAVQMLEQDHRAVEKLFREFSSAGPGRKQEVSHLIFKELDVHSTIEEEIFYPALRSQGDLEELGELEQGDSAIDGAEVLDQDDLDEDDEDDEEDDETTEEMGEDVIDSVYEDHQAVKELIERLRGLSPESPEFESGMEELKELVTDHVTEEEEVLFAEAKLRLDTKLIGRQMQERKQELLESTA
jgi:hemerythrin superfamily protein